MKDTTGSTRNQNTAGNRGRGGRALVEQRGSAYMREIGRRGGKALAAKMGTHYMSALGYAGALRTAELHYEGDLVAMMADLRSKRPIWDERNKCWKMADPAIAAEARRMSIERILKIYKSHDLQRDLDELSPDA